MFLMKSASYSEKLKDSVDPFRCKNDMGSRGPVQPVFSIASNPSARTCSVQTFYSDIFISQVAIRELLRRLHSVLKLSSHREAFPF